jgi:hypothetical protein
MNSTVSYLPICNICNKPVKLETAKADEHGKTVHAGCYLLKLGSLRPSSLLRPKI